MAENVTVTRSQFRGELADLHTTLVEFAAFVSGMLARAVQALGDQDSALADEVRRSDDVADDYNRRVEDLGLRLLSLQHPMAGDLRAVVGAIRIATDLERVGDYANDIAKIAKRLANAPLHWELQDISRMAGMAQEMLRLAVQCVVEKDKELAHRVARMDRDIDALWRRVRAQCMDHAREDPERVTQAVWLLLVARYLERVGDHVVNVAERVNFIETGRLEKLK